MMSKYSLSERSLIHTTIAAAGVVTVLAAAPTVEAAAGVTDADVLNDQDTVQDVVSYGMGPYVQRYSPLKQINKDTVRRLVPAWTLSYGGEKQRGQEAQPLVHDGKIFVTASY